MLEHERVRMQELALELEVAAGPVERVAGDRKLERLEMDPDLVRPARLEPISSRVRSPSRSRTSNQVTASRGVSVSIDRRVRSAAVTADRGVDLPRARLRCSPYEREVAPLDPALADRAPRALRRPPPSGRREGGPRCLGRAGGRSPVARDRLPPRRARRARLTSVSPTCPGAGWTTSPAGLSITSRCSSA